MREQLGAAPTLTVDTATKGYVDNKPGAAAFGVFRVRDYGAVGDGVADDSTAFTTSLAAMVAAGRGVWDFGTGVYKVTRSWSIQPPTDTGPLPYAVRGDGSETCTIRPSGAISGAIFKVTAPLFNPSAGNTGAARWSGFTLDGVNASGGASGIEWGDISNSSFHDIGIRNFSSGDGWFFSNPFGWCEGVDMVACRSEYNATQIRFDVGSGRALGTITTALTAATAYTSIAVSGGVSEAMYSGQKFVIAAATSAVGVYTQTVQTTAAVAQGATSIPVVSFTAGAAYPAGTAKVHFGGYGSFDYWNIHSLYIQGLANQNGWVSERSRGIDEKMDRLGSSYKITGNFRAGATNTGKLFWLKGNDTYSDTAWDMTCETGGTGLAHKSLQFDNGNASIQGVGVFSCYGFTAATFSGGTYQWGFSGRAYVLGVTDQTATLAFRNTRLPGYINVNSGPTPTRGGTTAAPVAGQYPNTISTTGQAWQNTTGTDVMVHVTWTWTGAGTGSFNVDVWNGLPAGVTMITGVTSGQKLTLSFIHYHNMWARVDFTGATVAINSVRFSS